MSKIYINSFTITAAFILGIFSENLFAQAIAGNAPPGTSIHYPNISLADSTLGSAVSDSLDIDCDNIHDIAIDLYKGNTTVDESHTLSLRILTNTIEVWRDSVNQPNMIPFYNLGDTMCNDGYSWRSDSVTRLACGGGFCWTGIHQANDKYIAYRKTSTQQIGWLKISFDLPLINTVTASVPEVLILCTESGTRDINEQAFFSISPNPTEDGNIRLQCTKQFSRIEIINSLGQVVKIFEGNQTYIILPKESGIYMVVATDEKGVRSIEKVFRQ